MSKKTLVLGASLKPFRYSNLAVKTLVEHGHDVVALGLKEGQIVGVDIETVKKDWDDIDTITLYLNPENQQPLYDYILSLNPRRIIFNPGAENDELIQKAQEKGIETTIGCTLVMLSSQLY